MTKQPAAPTQLARIERPVYLFWSEDKSRNPVEHGWGGSDLYRCNECSGWQGDGVEDGERHSLLHEAARAPAPLDVERLAEVYTKVRGAHTGNGTGRPDDEPGAPPCDWCRLAAEQHIEADAAYARLASQPEKYWTTEEPEDPDLGLPKG